MAQIIGRSGSKSTLKKMEIRGYRDYKLSGAMGPVMKVMFNPSTIAHSHAINYNSEQPPDSINSETSFKNVQPETLSFELLFDGTGANGVKKVVESMIEEFKLHTYYYIGDSHQPPIVSISWGKLHFKGRLTSLDITHTMFAPEGYSLRAKAKVSFSSGEDTKTQAKKKSTSSPDMSHIIVFQEGDNLPRLCEKIYGPGSHYLQVARVNNLVDFRNIAAGTELIFPPIKK